ncbi:14631_t:CDS:2, partial [Funneliformis geosporum]
ENSQAFSSSSFFVFLLKLLSIMSSNGEISEKIAKYAQISLGSDLSDFTNNEKIAWKGNESLLEQLLSAAPRDENAILFFNLMKGPWDRVDG